MHIAEVLHPKASAAVRDNVNTPVSMADLRFVAQNAWSRPSEARPFREAAASLIVAFDDAFAQVATGDQSAFKSFRLRPPESAKSDGTICCDAAVLYA